RAGADRAAVAAAHAAAGRRAGAGDQAGVRHADRGARGRRPAGRAAPAQPAGPAAAVPAAGQRPGGPGRGPGRRGRDLRRRQRRAAAVLRATPGLTVHERVTSDTTLGLGTPDQAMLSGSQFLATEPYEAGIAPVTIQFPEPGGQVLLLGYPAQDIWIRLTIGAG